MKFLSPPPSFYGGQRRNHRLLHAFLTILDDNAVVGLVNGLAQDVIGCVVRVGVSRVGRGHGQGIIDGLEICDNRYRFGGHGDDENRIRGLFGIPTLKAIAVIRRCSNRHLLLILITTAAISLSNACAKVQQKNERRKGLTLYALISHELTSERVFYVLCVMCDVLNERMKELTSDEVINVWCLEDVNSTFLSVGMPCRKEWSVMRHHARRYNLQS